MRMTIRERIEAFWAGERPDMIPYTIYQNEWRHTQNDPAWQPMYEQGLGVTWHVPTTKEVWHKDIEYLSEKSRVDGKLVEKRIIRTPIGEVYELYLDEWRQKFFLETPRDYEIMAYVVGHIEVLPDYENYFIKDREIAPYGISLVSMGRTPNQSILVDYVGLENYAYHLVDMKTEMAALYEALYNKFRKKAELIADGPGKFVSVLENFTAETLGPRRFRDLMVPVYESCFPMIRESGKIIGTHYDGQLASCKKLIADAPIDLIESVTPPPEGDMTLPECREAWPDKLLWSNINVGCYYLPENELKAEVLKRVEETAPDGVGLAFEVSELYPDNWKISVPWVLEALRDTYQQ